MTDTTAAAADGAAGITQAMQATTLEEQGHKVFVGNLSFATKDDELKELFGKHGTITEAQIILRGTRSLGYGFVTFASKEDAQKAVGALDKTEIGGRVVNVEIAKPPPGTPGGAAPRAAAKSAKKAAKEASNGEAAAPAAAAEGAPAAEGEAGQKKRPRPQRRKKRTGATAAAEEGADDAPVAADAPAPAAANGNGNGNGAGTDAAAKKKKKATKPKKASAPAPAEDGAAPVEKAAGPAKKRGPPQGEPSKTLLFVANLPFGLGDDGLKGVFEGYKVVSAHVVKRRFGPAEGRSKGFGFVELENEEEQKKALEGVQGKEVEGRALQVKVAVAEAKEKVEADQEPAPAAA